MLSVVERKCTTQQSSLLKKQKNPHLYSKCTTQVQGFKRLSELDQCAAVVNYGVDVQMEVEVER